MIGQTVIWSDEAGNHHGVVVGHCPAGTSFYDVLPAGVSRFRSINMAKRTSRHDRLVVAVEGDDGLYRLPRVDAVFLT